MLKKFIEREIARKHPFKSTEEIRAEVLAERDAIGHDVASRFTRGNVNIKAGEFLMREDLRNRRLRKDK